MSAAGLCVRPSGWHPAACRRISPLLSKHPRAIRLMLTEIAAAEGGILVLGRSAASL